VNSGALATTAIRTESSVVRWHQLLGVALTAIPLAERMLLYHFAMTAWFMLPERGSFERPVLTCVGRLGLFR
jgi:hypothetical protein